MVFQIRENATNAVVHETYELVTARLYLSCNHSPKTHHVYDNNWRLREDMRDHLIDMTLFGQEPVIDHYLHVSANQDPTSSKLLVAYTQDDKKGGQDIQTPIKVGAYLKKFYPELSSDQITELSGRMATRYLLSEALKFAVTAGEIRDVYERCYNVSGVHSCMAGTPDRFSSSNEDADVHPVEAYAGPDLQLAYVEQDGNILARTLVWPEKKLYGRVYGDTSRIVSLLEADGYTDMRCGEYSALSGARLTMIPIGTPSTRGQRYAAPYIDGSCAVHENETGDFLIIGRDPEGLADNYDPHTNGYVTLARHRCRISYQFMRRRDLTRVLDPVYGDSHYVSTPLVESNCTEYAGDYFLDTPEFAPHWTTFEGLNGATARVPNSSRSYVGYRCIDGVYRLAEACRAVAGVHVSHRQFFEGYRVCEMTGRIGAIGDMLQMSHGGWWSQEYAATHATTVDGVLTPNFLIEQQPPVSLAA